MKRIWLIRHGRPDYGTEESRCIGISDIPLSEEGRNAMMCLGLRAAEQEGDFLRNAVFFSSPLERAMDSCRAFLRGAGLEGRKITACERFREVDLGTWDGLTFREVRERFPEEYQVRGEHPGTFRTPGGETIEEAGVRFFQSLNDLILTTEKDMVIFSHSGAIRAALCILQGLSCDRYREFPLPFGGITELRYEEGRKITVCGRAFL